MIVGVAGAGKTTALDAASDALNAAGYRVLGTSTSGQAARTLGAETGIESRTLASLLWRLEQDQEVLDRRTVVIIDEVGMANDHARLALGVQRAGAKLVLVGDHRQLSAVGPGGALHALLERRPELVTVLDENVRQHDPAERHALAELRDGSVPDAVAWYAGQGRIHTQPNRADTLVAMANAWAADIDAGQRTALMAWRRNDVADLNRLARDRYQRAGHLTGADLIAPGGRRYAAGDRVVALAPVPTAGILTSQQLTIAAVDPQHHNLVVRAEAGRSVTLGGDAIDNRHLDHAYALTVHRTQGATYDRAHVLAAGGGRELAYVALSRARDRTTIHATADDLSQAVDDLQADWGVAQHQRWITDGPARPGRERTPQRTTLTGLRRPEATASTHDRLRQARTRIGELERDREDLLAGSGRWRDAPQGAAARALNEAADQLRNAQRTANDPHASRRDRRAASRALRGLSANHDAAEGQWHAIGEPAATQLQAEIVAANGTVDHLRMEATMQRLDRLEKNGMARTTNRDMGISL